MICISKRTAWHVQKFDQGKEFLRIAFPPFPTFFFPPSLHFICVFLVNFSISATVLFPQLHFFKIISIGAKGNRKGACGGR